MSYKKNLSCSQKRKQLEALKQLHGSCQKLVLRVCMYIESQVSSGSTVSDYGLDDRAIGVRSPAVAEDFFLYLLCPDRLWGPPSLLYNGYQGSFPQG
jgi:hypothetical protein